MSNEECAKGVIFDKPPPEIEVFIVNADESWPGLLTVSFFKVEKKSKKEIKMFLFYFSIIPLK